VSLAARRDETWRERLQALASRHLATLDELLGPDSEPGIRAGLGRDFAEIEEILRGVWLVRACAEQTTELVSGYGELWSAQVLDALLRSQGRESAWLDARQVLVVGSDASGAVVDWEATRVRCAAWLAGCTAPAVVITGFIASTASGIPTTLKRNGSDFSASIFGALLDAREVTIWTDVDGVLSADPRLVPEAVVVGSMSYDEATELAYFGAKVVHPGTMAPVISRDIPIWIRNTFRPGQPGTRIGSGTRAGGGPVTGFSTIEPMALLNVEGTGMMGVPGIAQRLFGALREVGVSVVMISQASSEHSICFAVPDAQGELARRTVETAFFAELHHGQIQRVDLVPGCSILAAVGDSMAHEPGVAGRFFGALGTARVNIRAIAQGSSERNMSVVIDRADSRRGLRAVHSAFFLSHQTISIGIIGPGLIGGTLLAQLESEVAGLRDRFKLDLRVRGILDSRRMWLADEKAGALDLSRWKPALEAGGSGPAQLEEFVRHIHADYLPHAALVDCTASGELPAHYPRWLARGLHIVTPNKKAGAGPLGSYREILDEARKNRRHYLYETTVGAGLPIINTLRELVRTGDRVLQVEGVLSGTLSFLFGALQEGGRFSEVVRLARQRGYTEPDPRDDLSGMDVARKAVILAREMGLPTELEQVEVESLVPGPLRSAAVPVPEFIEALAGFDDEMAHRASEARARGEVLRHVGWIHPDGRVTVGVRSYPAAHAFARIPPGDNIVSFTTARYRERPLIVQGPGAGPEVTAAGVFADLLRLAAYLGAPA
jgi:bifunctional aspartokinase / homoserine dehydrogenase 1